MADSQPLDGTHSDTEYDDTIGPEEVTIEEKWLQAARNGREQTMKEMIQQMKENEISLDINCRGNQKSNRGWSALHLASYFGHLQIVHLLLQNNADVNIVNTVGDTALHRAAYTGRLETVRALIDHNADVSIINSEGQTPTEAAKNQEIRDLLKAAENHENIRRHEDFLSSVREGDMDCVQEMLKSNKKPDVNSTDQFGNTALHIAAQANQREMAVFLLQTGISVAKKNVHDQTAVDFAKTNEMKQILAVRPVTEFTLHPHRFEGILSKKARFVGFRPVWVVLERGVLSYFKNRGDASIGAHRKGMKYLDEAKLYIPEKSEKNSTDFMMHYSDGTSHTFMVNESDGQLSRERWITCLKEHISYSTHYIQQGASLLKDGDEVSVKTLRDALTNAQATQKILERKVDELKTSVKSTQTQPNDLLQSSYPKIVCQVEEISSLSREACTSLSQCLNLFSHQDESLTKSVVLNLGRFSAPPENKGMKRSLQLKEEIEKSRVLQEALHALATEHLELEQSIGGKKSPSRYYDTDDDEFYECDDMENEEILDSDANQLSSSSNSHLDAVSFKSVTMDNDLIPERSIHGRPRGTHWR